MEIRSKMKVLCAGRRCAGHAAASSVAPIAKPLMTLLRSLHRHPPRHPRSKRSVHSGTTSGLLPRFEVRRTAASPTALGPRHKADRQPLTAQAGDRHETSRSGGRSPDTRNPAHTTPSNSAGALAVLEVSAGRRSATATRGEPWCEGRRACRHPGWKDCAAEDASEFASRGLKAIRWLADRPVAQPGRDGPRRPCRCRRAARRRRR